MGSMVEASKVLMSMSSMEHDYADKQKFYGGALKQYAKKILKKLDPECFEDIKLDDGTTVKGIIIAEYRDNSTLIALETTRTIAVFEERCGGRFSFEKNMIGDFFNEPEEAVYANVSRAFIEKVTSHILEAVK